jgi:hypothetical protein
MSLLYPNSYDTTHALGARSFSSDITPNATQRTTLIVAGCYVIVIGILWCVLTTLSVKKVLDADAHARIGDWVGMSHI